MDLMAPNPAIMGTGFAYLGVVIVVLIVGVLKRSAAKSGPLLWMKLNGPLVSIAIGESWAILMYSIPSIRDAIASVNGGACGTSVPASLDEYIIAGLWMAGGSGLVAAIWKDASDGSMKSTSQSDVQDMREKNDSKGGIGA